MPTIHLVRHGEVHNPNHVVYADLDGFNLSPKGVLEAHAAGKYLAGAAVGGIVTSPLARARQTATAIGRHHGIEPTVAAGLTETRQYPGWTGQRWDDLDTLYPGQVDRYLDDASALDDVEETISAVATRVVEVIERALTATDGAIVVVGHQDPTQAARLQLTRRPLSQLLVDPPAHASVTTLELGGCGWAEVAAWRPSLE